MKYSKKSFSKLGRIMNFMDDLMEDPVNTIETLNFSAKIKLRSMNNPMFAKKVESIFLPSNVVIMCVLALASYIFIFGPGAHPSFNTVLIFAVFASFCFGVMELIRRNTTDPEKHNIISLRLTIISLIVPLMLMQSMGMPNIFVFSIITFLIMSPLVYSIRSKWKISGHMCTFTAITTIMSLANAWFAALYIAIPVISWSRLKLKAHTRAQIIAGTLLGFLTPLTFSVMLSIV